VKAYCSGKKTNVIKKREREREGERGKDERNL
jgi:hypothetical protein